MTANEALTERPDDPAESPAPRMRVLLVCDWHLKYSAALAMALLRTGVAVAFLCRTHSLEFGDSQEELQSVLAALRENGAEILLLPGRISSVRSLRALARLINQVRAWRPEVVHAQENYDPRLLALARRYPLVVTVHDPKYHPGEPTVPRVEEMVWRSWLRSATRVIVHGERLRGVLPPFVPRERVAVIPHGTDPHAEPNPVPDERAILLYGRLAKYKGLDILLAAMEIIWRQRPEVKLLVYGKGEEARLLPDDPRIEASIGYVPEEMEDAMFAKASVVVLPYIGGSQSGVGVRSLARGIPTIVTDVGSLPDLALDDSFLVPASDPAKLANALMAHLDHGPELRRAVLQFARSKFSWDVVAASALDLYKEVLREASPATR
jgi:glycosyltransferase involved in cell wall biosynthesis